MSHDQPDGSSVVLVSIVGHNIEVWGPEFKLSLPVDNGGERSTDQEGTVGMTLVIKEKHTHCQRYTVMTKSFK